MKFVHLTDHKSIPRILRTGIRLGNGRHGRGVYAVPLTNLPRTPERNWYLVGHKYNTMCPTLWSISGLSAAPPEPRGYGGSGKVTTSRESNPPNRNYSMSTVLDDLQTRPSTSPSQRLRSAMAAARVSVHWFGVRKSLTEDDCEAIRTLCKAYVQLTELLKDKNTSLARLRKLFFGSQTEKTNAVVGNGKNSQSPPPQAVTASTPETEPVSATDAEKSPPKGHGRNGADAYTGAPKVVVRHESLQPGDPCPKCEEGTVYETGRPGVLVRLVGQSPNARKVRLEDEQPKKTDGSDGKM